MGTCFHPGPQLTKAEARAYLASGELPRDFAERVKLLLEHPCSNCDDRRCMQCVLRYVHENCADTCPLCCDPAPAL